MECGRGLGVGLSKKAGCMLFVLDIDGSVKVACGSFQSNGARNRLRGHRINGGISCRGITLAMNN